MVYVHAFDDKEVIAGQGTIGMEIVNQHPGQPDAIFVPVGGGGLISGIAAYVKYVYPNTKVIGSRQKVRLVCMPHAKRVVA